MKKMCFIQIIFIAYCHIITLPCIAKCTTDSIPVFAITCSHPDSTTISELNFLNTNVKHGYIEEKNKKLTYDDAFRLADMQSFPPEMLVKKNVKFKTKKLNVMNYGKCYYMILQFKDYPGAYLNGKVHILFCPSRKEFFVFEEIVASISTEKEYLLITNNCRGNISCDKLSYSKEQQRFILQCE